MHTDCKSTVLLHARLVLSEKGGHGREDEAIQSIASRRNVITTLTSLLRWERQKHAETSATQDSLAQVSCI